MADDSLMDALTRRRGEPRAQAAPATEPDEPTLPEPDAPYLPHSKPLARPVYTLHLLLGRDGCRSFQLVHLDSDSTFTADDAGQCIRLRFCGSKVMQVSIRGRNLRRLYDLIHQHRIAWVMRQELGRDFAAEGETVITEIHTEEPVPNRTV
ncbi:MAG: hypothetical protein JSS02_21265 [Planctomycetes bacterium]|nr:hypothetical protein [Planctomycetota bacterium]